MMRREKRHAQEALLSSNIAKASCIMRSGTDGLCRPIRKSDTSSGEQHAVIFLYDLVDDEHGWGESERYQFRSCGSFKSWLVEYEAIRIMLEVEMTTLVHRGSTAATPQRNATYNMYSLN
jgi:hypothetical protein